MCLFQGALPRSWGFTHKAPAQVLIFQGSLSALAASLKASQRRQPRALPSPPRICFPPRLNCLLQTGAKHFTPPRFIFLNSCL